MSSRTRVAPEVFGPVRTARAVDAVVDQIVDRIRSGRVRDGELLPGERQLASVMQVSRRTVRDAIEILQDAGVVAVSQGPAGGIRVASIWIPDRLTGDAEPVSRAEIFEILEARRVIEPRVAQLAALRGTDGDFRIMRETIELQRANQHDRWRLNEGNALFHRQLWRAGGNHELESAMRMIYRRLSGPFYEALEQDETSHSPEIGIDLHEETLQAIISGQPDSVEEVMDRHLAYLERRCEVAYGRARLPELPGFLVGSSRSAAADGSATQQGR